MEALFNIGIDKGHALNRTKLIATGLLLLVTLLFVVARFFEQRYPQTAVLSAFAEAAMIGALADWFAVVALFRHPLGIPIPHTAIIPNNKARIADNLGAFIAANFLGTRTVLDRIRQFDPGGRVAKWLAKRDTGAMLSDYATKALVFWLDAIEDERFQRFLHHTLVGRLETVDFSRISGELLDVLTHGRRHQDLLDKGIKVLSEWVRLETTQEMIAARIASELNGFLKAINYENLIGKTAARKLVEALSNFLAEVSKDEQHPMRQKLDRYVEQLIVRLHDDPELRVKVQGIRDRILHSAEVRTYLMGLWLQLRGWLRSDLQSDASTIKSHVAAAVTTIGELLRGDPDMQAWINEKIFEAAGPLIEQNREKVGKFIAEQVRDWDEVHMVRQFELSIGRDLQYIRINGTLVGGLIGLLIYGITRLLQS